MLLFECTLAGGGGGFVLTVTCASQFAGTTITCTDGVTTLTKNCPSTSPYTIEFAIPNGGTWTVSGVYGGATISESITIEDSVMLNATPEGSTVLPTDDIQTWLHCANIWNKSYTTLSEVLNDSTTLLAVINSNNAADYMVRSTTWATTVSADSTAMSYIGLNDYCAETLLGDSTWLAAICNSTYFESVLTTKVPTMTSNTTPSGECKASSNNNSAWWAFSGSSNAWSGGASGAGQWVGYIFPDSIVAYKGSITVTTSFNSGTTKFKLQGSTDGTTWNDVTNTISRTVSAAGTVFSGTIDFVNPSLYQQYRVYFETDTYQSGSRYLSVKNLQFYGRA